MFRSVRPIVLFISLGWGSIPGLAAESDTDASSPADKAYRSGIEQYRSGHIEQALQLFLAARDAGLQTPNLTFNIGLCYYRLRRYAESRTIFSELRTAPGYAAIANYHLALVASRTDNSALGIDLLDTAEGQASPSIKQLVRVARARIGLRSPEREPSAYVSMGAGYDSNLALLSEAVAVAGTEEADSFGELLAYGSVPFWLTRSSTTEVSGTAYVKEYREESELSQRALQLALRRDWVGRVWDIGMAGHAEKSYVGGEDFQTVGSLGFDLSTGNRDRWTLTYQAASLSSGERFEYLDGHRHRLAVEYSTALRSGRAALSYDVEYNDREDLRDGSEFFSHSPLRNRVTLRYVSPVSSGLSIEGRVRYRNSRYADPNVFFVDGALKQDRRVEDLLEGTVSLRYRLSRKLGLMAQYQYSDNESTFESFSYQRHSSLLAIEWLSAR